MPLVSLVYDPYFAALGGGELYAALLAKELAVDSRTTLLAPVPDLRHQLNRRFGLSLPEIDWLSRPQLSNVQVSKLSRCFDRFVCLTLGDPPVNQARTGILVIQFPVGAAPSRQVLASYQAVICYSRYCQHWIRQRWGLDAVVIAPAMPGLPAIQPTLERQNLIISIGRFQADLHNKGYRALFTTFSALVRDKMPTWEYYVIGGSGQSQRDRAFLRELSQLAVRCRVKILPDLARGELLRYLAGAKLFWHGAGCEEAKAPERAEHFGISIVEAMSLGVVPLVYAAGGPLELVQPGWNGFHWSSPAELSRLTIELAGDEPLRRRLADQARRTAAHYLPERLRSEFRQLLGRIER